MAYPCIVCDKQFKSEHAFITHWGVIHYNLRIERRLEALAEARRRHAAEALDTDVPNVVRRPDKPTT